MARDPRRPALLSVLAISVAAAIAIPLAPTAAAGTGRGDTAPAGDNALAWAPCEEEALGDAGFECARLLAPLDRHDPAGPTVSLALVRHRSTGNAAERIGSLVFNPGGPGGSGLQAILGVWPMVPDEVRQRFDLVSWDPRGVNASIPALQDCGAPWPARPVTGPVDWAKVVRGFVGRLGALNARCQKQNAEIIEHMGTMEAVEDLDRIRAAVGDERLTYWGMSYGTRIGYVYALLHPQRVRAIVLDGSIDPASTLLSLSEGGAAPDQAYGPFADVYPQADEQVQRVLARLEQGAVALTGGVSLTRWDVLDTVYNVIAQQGSYPSIARLASMWDTALFGTGAAQQQARTDAARLAQAMRRAPNSNAGSVFSVVNCLDYADRPGLAAVTAAVRAQVRIAPAYGGSLATMYATNCAGLRIKPDPVPVITGRGPDVPLMISGSTRDGSTIVQWTARMSRAFPRSRTVTYAGGQHVVWGAARSDCVNEPLDTYVITLRQPVHDLACPNVLLPAEEQAAAR